MTDDYPLHRALDAFTGAGYPVFTYGTYGNGTLDRFVAAESTATQDLVDVLTERAAQRWQRVREIAADVDLPTHVVDTIMQRVDHALRHGGTLADILEYLNARRVAGDDDWAEKPVLRVAAAINPELPAWFHRAVEQPQPAVAIGGNQPGEG